MSAARVETVRVQGAVGLRVSNEALSFTLLPALGGKLSSLQDRRTGREWLWTSPEVALRPHPYGAPYVEVADTGGWDECFPTVAACRYPAGDLRPSLPDHGELWSQAWGTQVSEAAVEVRVASSASGVALPYTFGRAVSLGADARLHLEYQVSNTGPSELLFIWSAHPLFRLEAGMRLRLPATARFHEYLTANGTTLTTPGAWPLEARRQQRPVALDPLPEVSSGVAFKVWSDPLDEGWACLEAPDGRLRFTFDPSAVPQLGVWLNAGGWSGSAAAPPHNLALEPCIGAQDSLQAAVERGLPYAALAAGETRRWAITLTLEDRRED